MNIIAELCSLQSDLLARVQPGRNGFATAANDSLRYAAQAVGTIIALAETELAQRSAVGRIPPACGDDTRWTIAEPEASEAEIQEALDFGRYFGGRP